MNNKGNKFWVLFPLGHGKIPPTNCCFLAQIFVSKIWLGYINWQEILTGTNSCWYLQIYFDWDFGIQWPGQLFYYIFDRDTENRSWQSTPPKWHWTEFFDIFFRFDNKKVTNSHAGFELLSRTKKNYWKMNFTNVINCISNSISNGPCLWCNENK